MILRYSSNSTDHVGRTWRSTRELKRQTLPETEESNSEKYVHDCASNGAAKLPVERG